MKKNRFQSCRMFLFFFHQNAKWLVFLLFCSPNKASMDRRRFITASVEKGFFLAIGLSGMHGGSRFNPLVGVCTNVTNAFLVLKAGGDFVEEAVGRFLKPGSDYEDFEKSLNFLKESPLPVPSCNSFFPAELRLTGDEVDEAKVFQWAETAFSRAQQAGVRIIVLGSGGARKIPDGFAYDKAFSQFTNLLARMGEIAEKYQVTIALEHLNRQETNFINTLEEANAIVSKVNHPAVGLLCDVYHMLKENETLRSILKAGKRIVHCHVAEKTNRAAPGTHGQDFVPYFRALKKAGFKGKISIECNWNDFPVEVEHSLKYIKDQINLV